MDMGGKREVKGDGRGEAEREKEASVRRIRGVFEVEEAREARESRLARNGERLFEVEMGNNGKYQRAVRVW